MIAFCGLNCLKCEAFLATQNNDDALRAKVAEESSRTFNITVLPEQINCNGCLSDGIKISYCDQCEIRKCAKGRHFRTCADCEDYACSNLNGVLSSSPDAKLNLDSLR